MAAALVLATSLVAGIMIVLTPAAQVRGMIGSVLMSIRPVITVAGARTEINAVCVAILGIKARPALP